MTSKLFLKREKFSIQSTDFSEEIDFEVEVEVIMWLANL